ncbi:AsmA-like C-terminal region-containing protein, partial [Escherichia coli]
MATLAGQVHMDVHSGQFLKVDPGAAKLLGVLNLQALPRRLTLDFRDVFSEGFAFDTVAGTAS